MARTPTPAASAMRRRICIRSLGDCNTVASEKLCPSDSVPVKLAELLTTPSVECVIDNRGGTMNCSREGVNQMRCAADPADIVLINYGLVDSWTTSIPFLYVPYFPNNSLRRQSRKILKSIKRSLRAPWIRRFVPCGYVVPPAEFRRNITRIVERSRQLNPAADILIWSTVLVRDQPARNESIQKYNAILREVAAELDCRFLDVSTTLESFTAGSPYLDAFHLNGEGAWHVAQAMLRCLGLEPTPASARNSAA